jgi:hypothetical protein
MATRPYVTFDPDFRIKPCSESPTQPAMPPPKEAAMSDAPNLLHEQLNLSTVHANDGSSRPLCGASLLGGETTAVSWLVDCAACLAVERTEARYAYAYQAKTAGRTAATEATSSVRHGPDVISNLSDLSPAMRKALQVGDPAGMRLIHHSTGDALQERGLVTPLGNGWYRLTFAGRNARQLLESQAEEAPSPDPHLAALYDALQRSMPCLTELAGYVAQL